MRGEKGGISKKAAAVRGRVWLQHEGREEGQFVGASTEEEVLFLSPRVATPQSSGSSLPHLTTEWDQMPQVIQPDCPQGPFLLFSDF